MKKVLLALCLIASSSFVLANDKTDVVQKKSHCLYAGAIYSEGAVMTQAGHEMICQRIDNEMTWIKYIK